MSKVSIVEEELSGFRGDTCLVKDESDNYYVVSTLARTEYAHSYGEIETMAFKSDSQGNILDWLEVAGGGEMTREDVIACLERGEIETWGSEEGPEIELDSVWYAEEDWDDYQRDDQSLADYDSRNWDL